MPFFNSIGHPSAFQTHDTRDCAFAPIDRRAAEAGDVTGIERLAYQFLTTYLPEDILTKTDRASMFNSRKKHGFALPVGRLIRTLFWTRCQDVLMSTDNAVAAWFRREAIEALLAEHAEGYADHGKKLWALYILYSVAGRRRRQPAAAVKDHALLDSAGWPS